MPELNPDARQVIVVGAGLAGLAAAHRLLERGFHVRLLDAKPFPGGKLGAHHHNGGWHEHAYHMYLNWYHNFWALMDEIGTRRHFEAMPTINLINRDRPDRPVELENFGSLSTMCRNMFSGLASPPDMFLYAYSLLDLISHPVCRPRQFDDTSVYGFMHSRPYMTPGAMRGSTRTLAEAFACPSYLSSARSYRTFVSYGFRLPSPSMQLLRGNTHDCIFAPWLAHLRNLSGDRFRFEPETKVEQLVVANGRIAALRVHAPHHGGAGGHAAAPEPIGVDGDLILAVPPRPLAHLVSYEVAQLAPRLANVHRLHTQSMISLDVYFKRRIPHVPRGVVVLLHSRHKLSFLDQSQIWRDWHGGTFLNVVMSDSDTILGYTPAEIEALVLGELRHYLRFDPADILRINIRKNLDEGLFINEVGSWDYRPGARTRIPNLF
ncbi:MAG: FAD-dependent oxidoreductase, partial [Alphaproteobacteria bacterium]|nr:FAD-dependent oxidoreductase [Alphaproteobacteria bacterium]